MYKHLATILPPALYLHGQSPLFLGAGDPLKALIIAILSQATSDHNCLSAFQSLMKTFPTWESLAAADASVIADAIRLGGLGDQKAPRIKQVLQQIYTDRGEYSLDWLAGLNQAEAYDYLTRLPGVGRKTAACVWGFGLGKPALPVDTHVYRVLRRLGLAPETDPGKLQAKLESELPPEIQRDFHVLLINFGRYVCRKQAPRCTDCALSTECDFVKEGGTE